jgi:hypothetical protein
VETLCLNSEREFWFLALVESLHVPLRECRNLFRNSGFGADSYGSI